MILIQFKFDAVILTNLRLACFALRFYREATFKENLIFRPILFNRIYLYA
jgi:hypothetical protein